MNPLSMSFPTPLPRSQVVSKQRMDRLVGTLGDGRGPGSVNNTVNTTQPQPLDTVTTPSLIATQVGRAVSESLHPATMGLQEQQAIEVAGLRREKDVRYI